MKTRYRMMVSSGTAAAVFWTTVTVVFLASISNCVFADETDTEHSRPLHQHHVQRRNAKSKFDRKLRIATIFTPPYTQISEKAGDGNNKYIGIIPDLMFQLSRRLGFEYEFYVVPDGKYGALVNVSTGEWNGMIGEVIKNDKDKSKGADIAAGPIPVTSLREKFAKFVKPFTHSGISIVVKKTTREIPSNFRIFQLFDVSVWGLIVLSVIVVGLFLWLMNRFNPYEWAGIHKRGMADKQQSEAFNLAGSMWFVFTSLQWQGFEKAPRSIASRFLVCVWFAFVSIILMAFTAGIVNHFFSDSMARRHRDVTTQAENQDLARLLMDEEFKYGALSSGATYDYVSRSTGEELGVIRRYLRSPEGKKQLVATTDEGIEKARTGKYAFLTETAMAKTYMRKKWCDLTTVGEPFAKPSFGLALPLNSAFSEELDVGILEMIEEGDMEELEDKWWIGGDNACWSPAETDYYRWLSDSSALAAYTPMSIGMWMFYGPFLLFVIGVFASLIVAVAEMLYYRRWGSKKTQGHQLKMEPKEGNI